MAKMFETVSRREMLATISATGAAALAGCPGSESSGASDVILLNMMEDLQEVSVEIGEDVLERTMEVDPNGKIDPINEEKLPLNSDYTIKVDVTDGPSESFDWEDPSFERAPLWIILQNDKNILFMLEAG